LGLFVFFVVTSLLAQQFPVKFSSSVPYDTAGHAATAIALGDFNGDGNLDFVVSNNHCPGTKDCFPGDGQVTVLLRNADGSAQVIGSYSTGGAPSMAVATGDLNGDGIPDLVVASRCPTGVGAECPNLESLLTVLLGNGDATFRPAAAYSSGGAYVSAITIADVNSDGHADIVAANACETPCLGLYPAGVVGVLLNNGDGTFQAPVSFASGGWAYRSIWSPTISVSVGDINEDSKTDLMVTNGCGDDGCSVGGGIGILAGNGDGTFEGPITYNWEVGGVQQPGIAIADLNGDGHLDVVVTGENYVSVLLGNGDGTFQNAALNNIGGIFGSSVSITDVNGDGHLDLITASYTQSNLVSRGVVSVLPGRGDGTFQPAVTYDSGGSYAMSVQAADVNGDGRSDIVVVNYCSGTTCAKDGTVRLLLNTLSVSTTTLVTCSPNPSQIGLPTTMSATVNSSSPVPDGSRVTFYNGTTQLGIGLVTNGAATFTTSFSKAKTYTIKAKYSGDVFHRPSTGAVKLLVQ
jgi:hypothetical protein